MDAKMTSDASGHHGFVGAASATFRDGSAIGMAYGNADVGHSGVHADGALLSIKQQGNIGGVPVGVALGAGDFTAEYVGRDGYFGVGAGTSLGDVAVNTGSPVGDPTASDDLYARAGGGVGAGGAVRLYVGTDVDGDGIKEFGAGGDFGPFSADVRIEHPAVNTATADNRSLASQERATGEALGQAGHEIAGAHDALSQGLHDTPPSHYK
jgi:hypothetical protein